MSASKSIVHRFMAFVMPVTESGCWIWMGWDNGRYGKFRMHGACHLAHKAAYQLFKGRVLTGQVVCHSCDTPLCVNPAHLFLGTQKANMRDMVKKGRHASANLTKKNKPHTE